MDDERQDVIELSDIEKSAIGEICDLMTSSLAKIFGEKLGSDVGMNPSRVELMEFSQFAGSISTPVLLLQLNFASGLEGQLFLFFDGEGLPKVFDLAIPADAKETGADDEVILEGLTEMVNNAIKEAMENFASSMGHNIACSVIDTVILQDESGLETISFLYPEGKILYVSAELTLADGGVNAGYLLPIGLSRHIIELLLSEQFLDESNVSVDASTEVESVEGDMETERQDIPLDAGEQETFLDEGQAPQVYDLQTAQFDLSGEETENNAVKNISLLLDVALDASIELGKTQMTIEEILKLGRGSVIELDKLASEPVEFLVNGKVIARGEVVVIDDNFGIRITEILSPKARLEHI